MTLLEAIEPQLPEVVAITGAGGKTTIMLQLAREARAAGLRTLITVTTKMYEPDPEEFGPASYDPAELAGRHLAVYAAGKDETTGKLLGIPPDALPAGFDLTLVESDGSLHLPLTAPREHEPVIPPSTTLVIAVAGLDAMDQPVSALHRPDVIAELTGLTPESPVTTQAIATVLLHTHGNTKGRPAAARVLYVLNKCDDELRLQQAKQISALLPGPAVVTVDGYVVWPSE